MDAPAPPPLPPSRRPAVPPSRRPAVPPPNGRLVRGLAAVTVAAIAVSALRPFDAPTGWMEVAPVLIGLPLLVATRRRFPLTTLAYALRAAHALILIAGGHGSYARVPLGDGARVTFGLERNPYDRLGHLAQGFVPAIVARERLLRTSPLRAAACRCVAAGGCSRSSPRSASRCRRCTSCSSGPRP